MCASIHTFLDLRRVVSMTSSVAGAVSSDTWDEGYSPTLNVNYIHSASHNASQQTFLSTLLEAQRVCGDCMIVRPPIRCFVTVTTR